MDFKWALRAATQGPHSIKGPPQQQKKYVTKLYKIQKVSILDIKICKTEKLIRLLYINYEQYTKIINS